MISRALGHVEVTILNDEERRQWILNDGRFVSLGTF